MERKEQHTDKCCFWDDADHCDCGERYGNKLEAEIVQLRAEHTADRDLMDRLQTAYESKRAEVERLTESAATDTELLTGALSEVDRLRADLTRAREENERLKGTRDRYKTALESIAAFHPNTGMLIQSGNVACEALADAIRAIPIKEGE